MKILLIQPSNNMDEIMGGARVFVYASEPLGILYLAAILEGQGHAVSVLDAWALNYSLPEVFARIGRERWDVIGISTLTSSGPFAYELGRHIKENYPGTKAVMGNVHAAVYDRFFLEQKCADVIVRGEGEITFPALIRAFDEKTPLENVAGISYLENGVFKRTGPGPMVEDLNDLPLPARHLVPMEKYTNRHFVTKTDGAYRVMHSTRGCPYGCTFCIVNANRNYRIRRPESVVDEMELLVKEHRATFIEFLDPLFTVNKANVIAICDEIVRRDLRVEWQVEGHVNTVNEEVLRAMKRAGCRNMAFGIETASADLLKMVRKGSTPARIRSAVEMTRRAGISPHGLFMIGLPSETRRQTMETIELALSLPIDFAQFSILVPYPGSEIYDNLVSQGKLDQEKDAKEKVENWRRFSAYLSYTGLDPVYVPDGRTIDELKRFQRQAIRSFYLRPRQIWKELKKFEWRHWDEYVTGISTVFFSDLLPTANGKQVA